MSNQFDLIKEQKTLCQKYKANFLEVQSTMKLGISSNVRDGIIPINGLRHHPEDGTTGWFIWAGEELSQDDDFFLPLHVEHLDEWAPSIKKYLGLAPGWRFLIAGDYEDVWYDPNLLEE